MTLLLTVIISTNFVGSLAEVSDSEEEEGQGEDGVGSSKLPTFAEEQEKLKESFKGAVVKLEEEEEEEGVGGEVLTLREKTKQEEVKR